ncbi:MAG TPA: saccharopine dehydrogenase NADP-binding domain-containing protein [Planctomycetota bacterium]|nr:saccharopine dehydrogenase NADP-binding domain-containing protein [Planctomycetota bacterium]
MNPGLLVLGASGNVARAVLRRLPAHRGRFRRIVLLDKNDHVRRDPYVDHEGMHAEFIHDALELPEGEAAYRRLLRNRAIDIVLDLTDADTLPILAATDAAGVSYLNTSLCDRERTVEPLVDELLPRRRRTWRAPHLVCAGMNPGAVNMWVQHGVERFGVPREFIHFEYDSSEPIRGWRPLVTWSKKEFLAESVWNPSGIVQAGRVNPLHPNALAHPEDLGPLLRPIVKLDPYPRGFTVLHEENIMLGRQFGNSSRFIYALHPRTMEYLVRTFRTRGVIRPRDLELGDNTSIPLTGFDLIGVCLDYPRRRVYYFHSLANSAVVGTNATCAQVAIGVLCGLFTLLVDRLPRRIHSVGDLRGTTYRKLLFDNLRVDEAVFDRTPHGLKPVRREPSVRLRLRQPSRRFYF